MKIQFKYSNDKEVFNIKNKDGVCYMSFNNLENTDLVYHGFSTRIGGVSTGEWSTMNLSFLRGDREDCVQENFSRIANAIGSNKDNIVCAKQTHTANVQVVDKNYRGSGITKKIMLDDVDGMVTNDKDVCLFTSYADCVPLYFLDPVKQVIGLSHSGWKGTVGRIGAQTIKVMKERFDCNPEDILVSIGPSICQKCYEVSEDVVQEFKDNFGSSKWNEMFLENDNGKYQLDLWRINEIILEEVGVPIKNVSTTNVCTACNWELLFSHRISNGKRGNLGALISLKN